MRFIGIGGMAIVVAGTLAAGCAVRSGEEAVGRDASALVRVDEASASSVTLFAGQTIDAGQVSSRVDNTVDTSAQCGPGATGVLEITFATANGWELVETHLAAGDDLADIPVNRAGNPTIGRFQYASGPLAGATSYSVRVPLCEFGLDAALESCDPALAYVAAHAVVRRPVSGGYQTETAWGDGLRFVQRGSWAEYYNLDLECYREDEPPPPPPLDCETAFAVGEQCFLSIDQDGNGRRDFSRWGWREQIDGSYSAPIYAGAAQCDVTKGTLVGTLNVRVNADGTVSAAYELGEGFELDETHLYVGDNLPLDPNGETTVAPGQFTEVHEDLGGAASDAFTLPGGVGDWLIAHAVVCGDFGG